MPMLLYGNGSISGITTGGLGANTVDANTLTTSSVTQPKIASGVGVTGPAFSVYNSTTQTTTNNVATKIAYDTKEYDTASCFSTSTYRFTPNVAGYYMFITQGRLNGNTPSYFDTWVYKNGSQYQRLTEWFVNTGGTYPVQFTDSFALYLNGTTDYIEIYFEGTNASGPIIGNGNFLYANHLRGFLMRAA